jgi:uncharacterized membrane-anchored protein YhcB (DUF1043 family)
MIMYSLEILLTAGVSAAAVGIITGYLLAKSLPTSKRNQQHLEDQLREQQEKQQEYQHEVTQHFSETAQLLNQLTSSYQDVHQHLAKGAQMLTEDQDNPILISLNKIEDTEPVIEGEAITADSDTVGDINSSIDTDTDRKDTPEEMAVYESNETGHLRAETTPDSNLNNDEGRQDKIPQPDDFTDKKS